MNNTKFPSSRKFILNMKQLGFKHATEDHSLEYKGNAEYMSGFREGLETVLERAKIELYEFDRDFSHVSDKSAADIRAALKKQEANEVQKLYEEAPEIGSSIIVISGRSRKVKKGDTGVIFWKGVNRFDNKKVTVGIMLNNGNKVFIDSTYVALDFIDFIHKGE